MRQLSGVDALHVLEESPDQHMHTVKIAILGPGPDGTVDFPAVQDWALERLPGIPALRWKVVKIPLGLARPVFLDAGPVDVAAHMDSVVLAAPDNDDAALDAVVSRVASEQLRRDRPLWDLTVVEGLTGGRTALVFKLHHSIMDGMASVRFLELVLGDAVADPPFPDPPVVPEHCPSSPELVAFALRRQAALYAALPAVLGRTVASIRVNRSRKKAGAPPVANPMSGPSTRFNRLPKPARIYVDLTVPLADVRAARADSGATINEVFVTVTGGAIRRYLDEHGELPDRALICAHPISLRTPEQRDDFGNRTSYWYVGLGTDIADPLERLAAVQASLHAAKEWAQGDVELFSIWQDYYLLFGMVTLKSLALAEKLSKRPAFNAVVSNVKGPQPLRLGDAPVVAVRSMGPITRVLGLNLTAWSYGENFSIGLQSCREFMPDLARLAQHWRDELALFRSECAAKQQPAVSGT